MSRLARRVHLATLAPSRRPELPRERMVPAPRGRTARKVRAHLRRMEPVLLLTPRWSATARFLDELALDLAVGEPAVGCRTVVFRPGRSHGPAEAWQLVLHVVSQLGRPGWRHRMPTTVADRRGFRWSLGRLLEEAHRDAPHRVALLAAGAEHLPVDVVEDLAACWADYLDRHPEGRRCTLLLAGALEASWIELPDATHVELADYAEDEAAGAIVGRAGPLPMHVVEGAARFSGGVPGLVEALGRRAREERTLPLDPVELMGALGPIVDEMRGAVDIVTAHDALADRLHELLDGEPLPEAEEVDHPLRLAGLVRRVRGEDGPRTQVRTPAIRLLVG